MSKSLTEIIRQEPPDSLGDVRTDNADFAQSGLNIAYQILAFMEEHVPTAMITRDYECWGLIVDELVLCREQMKKAIEDILEGMFVYCECSTYDPPENKIMVILDDDSYMTVTAMLQ